MATVAAAMAVATEEALRAEAEWEAVMTEAAVAVATEAAVWAAVAWEVAVTEAVAPVAVATEEAVRAAAVWAAVETEEAVWAVAAMAAEELVEVAREVVVWAVVERVAAVAETAAAAEAARLAAPVGQRVERAVVRAASSEGPPGYDYCGPSRSRRHPRRSVRTCALRGATRSRCNCRSARPADYEHSRPSRRLVRARRARTCESCRRRSRHMRRRSPAGWICRASCRPSTRHCHLFPEWRRCATSRPRSRGTAWWAQRCSGCCPSNRHGHPRGGARRCGSRRPRSCCTACRRPAR